MLGVAYKRHEEVENKHIPMLDREEAQRRHLELMMTDDERRERDEQFALVEACGLVFRQIPNNSEEAKHPKMLSAIDEEWDGLTRVSKTFNPNFPKEWKEVKRKNPRARRAPSHFVLGEKGMEPAEVCMFAEICADVAKGPWDERHVGGGAFRGRLESECAECLQVALQRHDVEPTPERVRIFTRIGTLCQKVGNELIYVPVVDVHVGVAQ